MVESAFNPMAYSRAHASACAVHAEDREAYDLEQNWWHDEGATSRVHECALDYLTFLYDMQATGNLALASYNWGEGLSSGRRANRARARQRTTRA